MSATKAVMQGMDTVMQGDLYMSFELGDKRWKVTASDGCRAPSQYSVDAGDKEAVLDVVRKAKARCKLEPQAKVHSCYEAGRDGWWLHRWLVDLAVICMTTPVNVKFQRRIQPVDATVWLNISAGVWKPRVFLGLSFNCLATALSLACGSRLSRSGRTAA